LPLNRVGNISKYGKAISKLEQQLEREPSPEELAEILEIAVEEVRETMKLSGRHVSVDSPFAPGEDKSLIDVLPSDNSNPDGDLLQDSLCQEVRRALATLTPREADVLSLYFGLGSNGSNALTLEEIGQKFCLTRERVRQIKEKAIRRLRQTKRSSSLKPYLG